MKTSKMTLLDWVLVQLLWTRVSLSELTHPLTDAERARERVLVARRDRLERARRFQLGATSAPGRQS